MRISLLRAGSLAMPGYRQGKAPPVLAAQGNAISEIS